MSRRKTSLTALPTIKFCLFRGTVLVIGNAVLGKATPYGCTSVPSTPCWFTLLGAIGEVFRAVHQPKRWSSTDTMQMGINIHLTSTHFKVCPFVDI